MELIDLLFFSQCSYSRNTCVGFCYLRQEACPGTDLRKQPESEAKKKPSSPEIRLAGASTEGRATNCARPKRNGWNREQRSQHHEGERDELRSDGPRRYQRWAGRDDRCTSGCGLRREPH